MLLSLPCDQLPPLFSVHCPCRVLSCLLLQLFLQLFDKLSKVLLCVATRLSSIGHLVDELVDCQLVKAVKALSFSGRAMGVVRGGNRFKLVLDVQEMVPDTLFESFEELL